MLLVNVHKLDIILAQTIGLSTLEHKVYSIGRVLGLESQDIFILGGTQDLGQGSQVDAKRDVAVAAIRREALGAEQHRNQSNVGVVHGLKGDTGVIAIEVAVLDQVLDRVDNLVTKASMMMLDIKRRERIQRKTYTLQQTGLLETGFQHCIFAVLVVPSQTVRRRFSGRTGDEGYVSRVLIVYEEAEE